MVEVPKRVGPRAPKVGIRPTYSVTPGSLTSWSVHRFRRIHKSTAPMSTSDAAIKPNALASNRRLSTIRP